MTHREWCHAEAERCDLLADAAAELRHAQAWREMADDWRAAAWRPANDNQAPAP